MNNPGAGGRETSRAPACSYNGGEPPMASLHFTCPQTHQNVSTGVETDAQSLRTSWKATLTVDCPYCGAVHEIAVREAYLDSAIHAATDRRPARAQPRQSADGRE